MKRWLMVAGLLFGAPAGAGDDVPTPADLPSTELAKAWLEQDPTVQEARANVVAARHAAGMLAASPHEWSLTVGSQRRRFESGTDSREWTAHVEHAWRLPSKAAIDRELGSVEVDLAQAQYHEAMHEAARDLLDLWMDWLRADYAKAVLAEQVQFAESNRHAVEVRRRAGDASLIELNVAAGDVAELQRKLNEETAAATKAQASLKLRFPAVPEKVPVLRDPLQIDQTQAALRDRIAATSDPLRVAALQLEKAHHSADRASADKRPDPTVGVYGASENFGNERIVGITVSVPLPGRHRNERLAQALAQVDAAVAASDRAQRTVDIGIAEAYIDAASNHERWRLAEGAAATARDTARLTQRAYSLGEGDLQTLLLARRQSLEVSQSALEARVAALRAHYRLLVDAHSIWGLAHE